MSRLKRYNQFIKESLNFEEEINEDEVYIKADLDGDYVGTVHFQYVVSGYFEFEDEMTEEEYNNLFPNDSFARIEALNVSDEYKGKGYGKELISRALKEIKKTGEDRVYLNANPMGFSGLPINALVEFYKKFGFEVFVDDYTENKEMVLKLESSSGGPNQTLKTIDAYIKMYQDEVEEKEQERIYREEEEEREDIVVDDFDEDTPETKSKSSIIEPTRKHNSLGQGATNMP